MCKLYLGFCQKSWQTSMCFSLLLFFSKICHLLLLSDFCLFVSLVSHGSFLFSSCKLGWIWGLAGNSRKSNHKTIEKKKTHQIAIKYRDVFFSFSLRKQEWGKIPHKRMRSVPVKQGRPVRLKVESEGPWFGKQKALLDYSKHLEHEKINVTL